MDNELIIAGSFLCAGLLACVIIPGLLVAWCRPYGMAKHRNETKRAEAKEMLLLFPFNQAL